MAMLKMTPRALLSEKLASGALQDDPGQQLVAEKLDRLHSAIMSRRKGLWHRMTGKSAPIRGLYIHGGVGRGKTMLMDMFFATLPQRGALATGWRLHFHDFMVLAQDLIHEARARNEADPIAAAAAKLAAKGDVLCFDEMEVRDIADAMIVARLFTSIFDAGVTVVATSNRHPDDLYKDGLHRDRFMPFIALLKQHCEILAIPDGADWRASVLAGMPAWYSPADSGADNALQTAFDALRGSSATAAESLRVAGRDVVISQCAGDIALVDFSEICEVPLAARDYLAIAGRFAGIMIRGVPRFSDGNEAAARRFMWLVDALYDRSRFLIASAEAEIDDLYDGHHFAFEFSRTASRLGEMTRRGKLFQTDT